MKDRIRVLMRITKLTSKTGRKTLIEFQAETPMEAIVETSRVLAKHFPETFEKLYPSVKKK